MATDDWSVADTAAHVATIAFMYTHIARFDAPAVREQILATTVDNVSELNARTLGLFAEREPATSAARPRADIDDILAATADVDPATPVPWLGDSRVPICGVLAHLVNELRIHGRDIARATGTPWPVPAADAALFFEVFFVEMLRHDVGRLLDNDVPRSDRRTAVEFRSRHTTPVTIVLHNGRVSAEAPGGALTGKVIVWGRGPWLLPTFLRTVRCP